MRSVKHSYRGLISPIRLAIVAAVLSAPALIDILFAITIIHDVLGFVVMYALLLSFLLAVSSVVVVLRSPSNSKQSVIATIAIATVPFVVLLLGFMPVAGILRPLVGLNSLW